jgi:hypothetical protein
LTRFRYELHSASFWKGKSKVRGGGVFIDSKKYRLSRIILALMLDNFHVVAVLILRFEQDDAVASQTRLHHQA